MKLTKLIPGVLALLFLMAESGLACVCMYAPTVAERVAERFRDSNAIFLGEVVDVDSWGFVEAKFKVERSWKGVTTDEVIVVTDRSSCGIPFRRGERYVVFGSGVPGGEYSTGACSQTTEVANAGEQLAYLDGKATIPLNPAPKDYYKLFFVTGAFVLGSVAIGLLLTRIIRRLGITTG